MLSTSAPSVTGTLLVPAARARKMAWEDELEMALDTSSSLAWNRETVETYCILPISRFQKFNRSNKKSGEVL